MTGFDRSGKISSLSPILPFILPTCEILFFWAEKEAASVPKNRIRIRHSIRIATSPCKITYFLSLSENGVPRCTPKSSALSSPSLHTWPTVGGYPWLPHVQTDPHCHMCSLQKSSCSHKYSECPTEKLRKYTMTQLYMNFIG